MSEETKVPHIGTVGALRRWVLACQERRQEVLRFLPVGDLAREYPGSALWDLVLDFATLSRRASCREYTLAGSLAYVDCALNYRPCVLMLDAWRSGDPSALNSEERKALRLAGEIVEKIAGGVQHPVERLFSLYATIGARTRYGRSEQGTPEFARRTSAACALLTRRANCQGFSEIMYLLGGMMGFSIGLQCGCYKGEPHMWNTITLDGRSYFMDCTVAADSRSMDGGVPDFSSFLMGAREAAEQAYTWRPTQEERRVSARLAPAHDAYAICGSGVSAASVRAAARAVWRSRLEGRRHQDVRIRAGSPVSIGDISKALSACGSEPPMCHEIGVYLGGQRLSFTVTGREFPDVTYCTVEWPEEGSRRSS